MPTVPQYGAPKVQQSAGQANLGQITARPDAEVFNAGPSMDKVTSAATALYDKVKNDADQVAVLAAESRLTEFQTRALYDPKTGALNKKGKDAFGSVESVNEDLGRSLSDIENGLSNQQQKLAFRQKAEAAKSQINRSLNQHVATEISRYDNEQTESLLTGKRNLVTAAAYDPAVIQQSKQDQAVALYQFAERNGKPPEWAQLKIQEAESATNMAVLQKQMADGNDVAAEAFFKENAETFHGQDRLAATKMVEEGSALGKAMRMADDSVQKGMSFSQMMVQAREIESPKVRRAFEDRARDLDQQRKMAKADFEEKTNIQAANFIDQGGSWQDYAKKNPTQWAQLTEAKRENIMGYRAGGAPKTDLKTWYTLKDLATNPETRADFNRMDLTKYMSFLSASDFQQVAGWQMESRSGKTKGLDGFQSDNEVVNAQLTTMGYSATKIKDKVDPEIVDFRAKVDAAIIAYEERSGKKPNNEELRKMVKSLSYETVVSKGYLWDTKKRFYQLSDAEIENLKASDIPKEYRSQIAETLKKAGRAVNEQNQLDLWVKKLKRDSGRNISAN